MATLDSKNLDKYPFFLYLKPFKQTDRIRLRGHFLKASVTKTVESGAFIRTTIRCDDKRRTTTRRMTKSLEKVIIGHVGDFEVYVYPYKFPDTVFIGAYPVSTQISSDNVRELISAYHKARWFLNGYWQNKPNWRIGPNSRKRDIKTAYDNGLNAMKASNNARKRL